MDDQNLISKEYKSISEALYLNTNIREISLNKTQIKTQDLKLILRSILYNQIESLFLQGNEINNLGAKIIADFLKENTFLKKLDLADNLIDDQGIIFISEALKTNNSIKKLNVEGNKFKEKGYESLLETIKINSNIVEITFDDNVKFEKIKNEINSICKENKNYKEVAEDRVLTNLQSNQYKIKNIVLSSITLVIFA